MSYQQYGGNPYHNAPNMEGAQGAQGSQYEMSNLSATSQYSNSAAPAIPASSGELSQNDFFAQITFIKEQPLKELHSSIEQIGVLHQRALSSPDSSSSAQLEALITQTQLKCTQIRDSIKYLETDAAKAQDAIKMTHVKMLKTEFEKQLREYHTEEETYKEKVREQIGRQYQIVNPQASEEEIKQAEEMDWGNEGIFQAALKSNRSGQAFSILGAVRARHNEIQRIEMTLAELASMFADMAQIVEAQEPVVQRTEDNAIKTAEDVNRGNVEINKANEHARSRNRMKWWCLLVVVLIIIVIALGVGLGVGLAAHATKTVTG